jgi:hypothetical protein
VEAAVVMTTKRTPITRGMKHKITPRAVELFRVARQMEEDPAHYLWPDEGGYRDKYCDVALQLHVELGRMPWDESAVDDPEVRRLLEEAAR